MGLDYRKFNILLAYTYISGGYSSVSSISEIRIWMNTWDPNVYKYRINKRDEILTLLPYNPITSYQSLQWYWNAEHILNPFPEEDLWIVINLLKTFLTNPQEMKNQIQEFLTKNQVTRERLIIESDNFHTLLEESSIPVNESSNLTDLRQVIKPKNQKSPQLPSRMDMLLEMAFKRSLKVGVNKK